MTHTKKIIAIQAVALACMMLLGTASVHASEVTGSISSSSSSSSTGGGVGGSVGGGSTVTGTISGGGGSTVTGTVTGGGGGGGGGSTVTGTVSSGGGGGGGGSGITGTVGGTPSGSGQTNSGGLVLGASTQSGTPGLPNTGVSQSSILVNVAIALLLSCAGLAAWIYHGKGSGMPQEV